MDADAPSVPALRISAGAGVALGLSLGFTVLVGFLPQFVFDFARHASVLRLHAE